MMRQLSWFDPPKPCLAEDVGHIESSLGIRLPSDYREFLMLFGGGSPIETDFELSEARGIFNASVGIFLSGLQDDYGIIPTLENLRTRSIEGLLPIAESGGGDLVCLDYRAGDVPSIAYWHHGRLGMDDEVVAISDSFDSFLEMLHEPID